MDVLSLAVGVDVSVARGLDVVVLDGQRRLAAPPLRRQSADDLRRVLVETRPAVVAIDAPPAWGTTGRSRACERAVRRLGMGIFATPSDPAVFDHPFYAWMFAGHRAFAAAAAAGYPALEVYPHATGLRLGGDATLGSKRVWRRAVLEAAGIDTAALRSLDALDAALAALTGLLALEGLTEAVGDEDGQIVLPVPAEVSVPAEGFEPPLKAT